MIIENIDKMLLALRVVRGGKILKPPTNRYMLKVENVSKPLEKKSDISYFFT
jgi:hypothetical protein